MSWGCVLFLAWLVSGLKRSQKWHPKSCRLLSCSFKAWKEPMPVSSFICICLEIIIVLVWKADWNELNLLAVFMLCQHMLHQVLKEIFYMFFFFFLNNYIVEELNKREEENVWLKWWHFKNIADELCRSTQLTYLMWHENVRLMKAFFPTDYFNILFWKSTRQVFVYVLTLYDSSKSFGGFFFFFFLVINGITFYGVKCFDKKKIHIFFFQHTRHLCF